MFGVRAGQAWCYPKFQFRQKGQPYREIRQVIEALTPDESGWGRLQWFKEPHAKLNGRTPLEAWEAGEKDEVVAAAKSERWHGRD